MFRTMLKSKIHRATVTHADLNYVGSLTVDSSLLEEANLLPNELVQVVDINNGARFETYVIAGERDSGVMKVNGAAARLVQAGDLIIVIGYGVFTDAEAKLATPRVLFVDNCNRITEISSDPTTADGRMSVHAAGPPASMAGSSLFTTSEDVS